MKITKEDIKIRFKEYNKLYFDNILPIPKFSTFIGRNSVGLCRFNKEKRYLNKISIARNVDWCEDIFKNVILHEMIHYFLGLTYGKCYGNHKNKFKNEMLRFKNDYNIIINVSYPMLTFIKNKKTVEKKNLLSIITQKIKIICKYRFAH